MSEIKTMHSGWSVGIAETEGEPDTVLLTLICEKDITILGLEVRQAELLVRHLLMTIDAIKEQTT